MNGITDETPPQPVIPTWTFGDRLRKVRRDVAQLSQAEFAGLLALQSSAAYAAWELGTNVPRDLVAVAQRVEQLTGVPAAWLLGLSVPEARTGLQPNAKRSSFYISAGQRPARRPTWWDLAPVAAA